MVFVLLGGGARHARCGGLGKAHLLVAGLGLSALVHGLFDYCLLAADTFAAAAWLRFLAVPLMVACYLKMDWLLEAMQPAADVRPADVRPADVRPADVRPADVRLAGSTGPPPLPWMCASGADSGSGDRAGFAPADKD